MATKSDEIRVRRKLARRGLRLERCRRRDPGATGHGLYRVATAAGVPVTGPGYTLTVRKAEAWCEKARPRRSRARDEMGAPEPGSVTVLVGDARRVLEDLTPNRYQCCVCSPPYWRQRRYGGRREIGWEATPEAWADALVAVFREVRTALRDDGTLWIVVGDGYNNRARVRDGGRQSGLHPGADDAWRGRPGGARPTVRTGGLKEKDLLLLPYLLAAALRADGWWLRSMIVWAKTSHLPESVEDRPTASHEHVLMLSKSSFCHYDGDAIAEPAAASSAERYRHGFGNGQPGRPRTAVRGERASDGTRQARNVWHIAAAGVPGHPAAMPLELAERCVRAGSRPRDEVLDPFGGSGTTGLASARLGRSATLIESSPRYAAAARKRLGEFVVGGS